MSDSVMLSKRRFNRIKPYFPLSHGVSRVDDLRVISGIIYVIKNGLQCRDAPRGYGVGLDRILSCFFGRHAGFGKPAKRHDRSPVLLSRQEVAPGAIQTQPGHKVIARIPIARAGQIDAPRLQSEERTVLRVAAVDRQSRQQAAMRTPRAPRVPRSPRRSTSRLKR